MFKKAQSPNPTDPNHEFWEKGPDNLGSTIRDPPFGAPSRPPPLRDHTPSGFGLHPPFWRCWCCCGCAPCARPPDAGPPLRRAPLRRTAQNFALFFSLSRPHFFLSSLSPGFGAAGVSHDNPKTPNVHISGPRRFTKIPRKDPQEREERKKIVAGEGKKSAKIWAPPFRAPPFRAPPFGAGYDLIRPVLLRPRPTWARPTWAKPI